MVVADARLPLVPLVGEVVTHWQVVVVFFAGSEDLRRPGLETDSGKQRTIQLVMIVRVTS